MWEFNHNKLIDIFWRLYFLRERKSCFLQNPVITLLLTAFLTSEKVSASYHRYSEVFFDLTYTAVGSKGTIRDKKHIFINQFLLVFRQENFVILFENNSLINNASLYVSIRISLSSEVFTVCFFSASLADSKSLEFFFNCPITDVKARVRGYSSNFYLISMSSLHSPR